MSRKSLEEEKYIKGYLDGLEHGKRYQERLIAEADLWKARCRVLEKQIRTEDIPPTQEG